MEIRPATPGDFEVVREVARRAWHATYEEVLDDDLVDATVDDWYADESLAEMVERPGTALLVAVDSGDVIGFCHGVVVGDEGDVLRLYVEPDRWGEGVGTALFERFREDLVDFNMRRLRAMVLADNERGAAFYESLGFERTGEAETELGDESHREAVYTLDLNAERDAEAAGTA
jgi:ribosomal protein S18 acetylase RimI-like enzyme